MLYGMLKTAVAFYRERTGSVPFLEWLDRMPPKAAAKCVALKRLRDLGHELRRPEADYLRDNIHELRISLQAIHYRVLYFFHGTAVVVVSHGLVKEKVVPPSEIDRAVARRAQVRADPKTHLLRPEEWR
jgi:phage-related protein